DSLPASSCFSSLDDASNFFEGGSTGYSITRDLRRLDGIRLKALNWRVSALEVERVHSSFYADRRYFPEGSVEFDHALVMRDIEHEWHSEDAFYSSPDSA
ncbi:MAG: hypothetical protein L0312_29190, partial [Acidobacteria bacterium]|nr:hypothetical protein [Acidobacteriota bacterium]